MREDGAKKGRCGKWDLTKADLRRKQLPSSKISTKIPTQPNVFSHLFPLEH